MKNPSEPHEPARRYVFQGSYGGQVVVHSVGNEATTRAAMDEWRDFLLEHGARQPSRIEVCFAEVQVGTWYG